MNPNAGRPDYANPAAVDFARSQLQHAGQAGIFGMHGPAPAQGSRALIQQYHQLSPQIAAYANTHGPLGGAHPQPGHAPFNPQPVPAPVNIAAARLRPHGPAAAQRMKQMQQTIADLKSRLDQRSQGQQQQADAAQQAGMGPDFLQFLQGLVSGPAQAQNPMAAFGSYPTDPNYGGMANMMTMPTDMSLISMMLGIPPQ